MFMKTMKLAIMNEEVQGVFVDCRPVVTKLQGYNKPDF